MMELRLIQQSAAAANRWPLLSVLLAAIIANAAQRLPGQDGAAISDRIPAPRQMDSADAGQSLVKGYRVAASDIEAIAAELRAGHSGDAGVRIAADRRTGQLLVLAPLAVHGQIAAYLQGRGYSESILHVVADRSTKFVPLRRADPAKVQQAVGMIQAAQRNEAKQAQMPLLPPGGQLPQRRAGDVISLVFQMQGEGAGVPPADAGAPGAIPQPEAGGAQVTPQADNGAEAVGPEIIAGEGSLMGPVRIEFIEGLNVIIIRGNRRDVERVTRIIEEIERQSIENQPLIEIHPLRHVDSQALSELVVQLYEQVLSPLQGKVSITALAKPNALLLIGRREGIDAVIGLVEKLDQPVPPATQFQVFHLQHLGALEAEQTINNFFAAAAPTGQAAAVTQRGALAPRVRVVSDYRTNSLVVQASPSDLREVGRLIQSLDVPVSEKSQELRVFKLKNALATELSPVLQAALTGQAQAGVGAAQFAGAAPGVGQPGVGQQAGQIPSSILTFLAVDAQGARLLKSGILADVRVTADATANALVVRGPAESMDLIAALIEQLDQLPAAGAQIKVFTIINGDATGLTTMLQQLFGQATGAAGGGGAFGQGGFGLGGLGQLAAGALGQLGASAAGAGESSLVPLRFAVDQRTNSIIASGSPGDLNVVEAILVRLDVGDVQTRKTTVYRLRNAPALDVANAINQLLQGQRQVEQVDPRLLSPFEQIEREVIVVPELVTNSLIISATPRFYEEIIEVVEQLDARPPMVMIQVLIAEVALNDVQELGAEFGLQDSLLFDRSVVANNIVVPGFNFNNQPLGNSSSAGSLATREVLGSQGLSTFGVGRVNPTLGYGGLVLSAANESVNILIRALQEQRRMQILSRPQVMTLDNQPAFIQVGARVPRITSTQIVQTGTINNTVLENVGILLGVTPRTSPDGLIVMEINAEKSELGPIDQGIPISINQNGDVIRSPQINITTAQTTVSARSGQTVVFAGLITKTKSVISRRVPFVADIPLVGNLFRFDSNSEARTELLIILTPYILKTEEDAEWMKRIESARMSWCLADVFEVHGETSGLDGNQGVWGVPTPATVFPDFDPTGMEALPMPSHPMEPFPLAPPDMSGRRSPSIVTPPASAMLQSEHVPMHAQRVRSENRHGRDGARASYEYSTPYPSGLPSADNASQAFYVEPIERTRNSPPTRSTAPTRLPAIPNNSRLSN